MMATGRQRIPATIILVCAGLLSTWAHVEDEGYMLFCPCMGRFGNQVETYLGTLSFAKRINRTLVLAPFLEYPAGLGKAKPVPFSNVFRVEALREYHRVVPMEEFMVEVAPKLWPKSKREVFCWSPRQDISGGKEYGCHAKEGNPFGPFWDYYDVDFVADRYFQDIGYDVWNPTVAARWINKYPASQYPVIAFSSAPAPFPIRADDRPLQRYLKWSYRIEREARDFVQMHLERPFIGVHLRNNIDWVKACEHVDPKSHFFASAQCTGEYFEFGRPTREMCLPSEERILGDIYREVRRTNAKSIFVSTDKDHMLSQLYALFNRTVDIRRLNKDDPYLSLAILDLSDHLIANCMSSYSAFAVRQRLFSAAEDDDASYTSFSFFGFNQTSQVPAETTPSTGKIRVDAAAAAAQKTQRDEL